MSKRSARRLVGWLKTYARRMCIWGRVARQVSGVSALDRWVLWRAVFAAPLDALRNLDEWRDPQVGKDCEVRTSLGRFRIRAASDDLYLVLPSREPAVLRAISELLRPGDNFIDAGANIGAYTVLASRLVDPGGRVIAVEMMPETADILGRHVRCNNCINVEIVQRALSDASGKSVMASVEPGKFGSASIAIHREGDLNEVQTVTLAELIADTPRVRLIKMDLEGEELSAARGVGNLLDRVEYVLFEDWGDNDVSRWFSENGFDVVRLDPNNSLAKPRGSGPNCDVATIAMDEIEWVRGT